MLNEINKITEYHKQEKEIEKEKNRRRTRINVVVICIIVASILFPFWSSYSGEKDDLLAQTVFERMEGYSFENKEDENGKWKRVMFYSDGFLYYYSGKNIDTTINEESIQYMYKQIGDDSFQFFTEGHVVEGQFINYYTSEELKQEMTFISFFKDGIPGSYNYRGTLNKGQLKLIDEEGEVYILERVE
ncbi:MULTISPECIES: hypothetical protein [unclassified Acetobacterium]|jgi:hypothetical protein|uniref:hypothetical protein n=1 Tax=unclassified Acetobacterium TaxID=2638182 RepID=UPI000DBEBDF7|nr:MULTISPECIES: hypothetical protein [unclassified Acetobacterium]AWW28374.1 hypothetical protein DOZ58_17980 [Acetobacterium sp. KB-1]MDZ5726679.1 hypothetical protein [Acetobacterium sp. K1/6]